MLTNDGVVPSLPDCQEWWRTRVGPQGYLDADASRSEALVSLIQSLDSDAPSIMEIGCNCGRNLKHLWDAGYRDLHGIEISQKAIALMRAHYSELQVTISPNAVEDIIKSMPTGYYDVVFTMATLLHLHPISDWVFAEMKRICAHYIITIERENSNAVYADGKQRQFARDYGRIFTALGCKQIRCQNDFGGLKQYTMRTFAIPL